MSDAPTSTIYSGSHPLFGQLFGQLEQNVSSYTVNAGKLAAADGDQEKALASYMETSEDPQAVKLRTAIANATAKLRELAEKNVVTEELSDDDKKKLEIELNSFKELSKKGLDAVKSVLVAMNASLTEEEVRQVEEGIKTVATKIGSGRGRKPGVTGSSLPRASVTLTVTGGNLKEEVFETFTALAQKLSAEPKDLQVAFANAAGVEHENIKEVKVPVTFEFTPPYENASTYLILATPKEGKPRGRKPVAVEAAASE